ncbi:MAG: phosphatidylglycerophosphatase A [Candidatus Spechtbacterales bacterium]|nr:phosphatidylglycerophosphatase A [Candidatus Spechtbacterales bacterium]
MTVESISIFIATFGQASEFTHLYGALGMIFGYAWFILMQRFIKIEALKRSIIILSAPLAMVIAEVASLALDAKDPSIIVLDEFVAVPFIFLGYKLLPVNKRNILIGLLPLMLFGLLDNLKPLGIRNTELFTGGIGIVADDLAAALITGLILYFIKRWQKRLKKDS